MKRVVSTLTRVKSRRLSSGVAGLDAMLHGGFLEGDSTLIAGSPGTGKTTLSMQFLAAGAERGEPGVFITFEYLPQQIYRDGALKGWPMAKWDDEGLVRVICTSPEILMESAKEDWSLIDEAVKEVGAKRVVLDSLSHFQFNAPVESHLRDNLAGLMNHLRLLGVTTVATHEIPQIVGPAMTVSSWGLEFLVDNVILLRYVELDGELEKAINVLKFRGGEHDRAYRKLMLTDVGAVVESEFAGVENISSGAARRSLKLRARDLI